MIADPRYDAWNRYHKLGQYAPQPKKKPNPRSVGAGAAGPPPIPNFRGLLDELAAGPTERTEAEWDSLLNPRMQPYIDAVEKPLLNERARNEYLLETKSAAQTGLSTAMMSLLTGGKTGVEAEQYAKQNFGGSYLPGQILSLATDAIRELTNDFDERDWQLTGAYLDAMAKMPGIREELREKVEADDIDEHSRKVQLAALYTDETWKFYNENRRVFEHDEQRADDAAFKQQQLRAARESLGLTGYDSRKDAVAEMKAMSSQTGTVWQVQRGKDGSWVAYDTGKPKPKSGTSGGGVSQRNSALREARDMTLGTSTVWRVRKEDGGWVAYDTGKPKAGGKSGGGGVSDALLAERDLAVKVLTEERDTILGKASTSGVRSKGMTPREAYDYLYGLAEAALSVYGRKPAYLDKWVKDRLKALGLASPTPVRRSGP